LRAERPTLLGVQEALPDQARFVHESLGPAYQSVGHGRDKNGRGEACPIYYNAERLELLGWEQAALSNQPTCPGSTSWGNVIPRIMVCATFLDRATSRRFLAVNTHLDHLSWASRLHSARAIRAMAATSTTPSVVTGDLNAGAGSAPLRALLDDGTLADTWNVARHRDSGPWGTFSNYRQPRLDGRRIDWILASQEFGVSRSGINTLRYDGGWASDHLPVQAVLVLPGTDGTP
jgi:endonuclease/exonuclease/phosphatase family metal-dependent hydrolase